MSRNEPGKENEEDENLCGFASFLVHLFSLNVTDSGIEEEEGRCTAGEREKGKESSFLRWRLIAGQ